MAARAVAKEVPLTKEDDSSCIDASIGSGRAGCGLVLRPNKGYALS